MTRRPTTVDLGLGLALTLGLACGTPAKDASSQGAATGKPAKQADAGAAGASQGKADEGADAGDAVNSKSDHGGSAAEDDAAGGGTKGVPAADGAAPDGGGGESGAAQDAAADEGGRSDDGGKSDDGGAEESGAPPADPVALLKEVKSKKTEDERALAALAEAEAAGSKPKDLAKAAVGRAELLHAAPERAKVFFEWARDKDPKTPNASWGLAKAAVNQGELDEAKLHLQEVSKRGGKKLLQQIDFDPSWEVLKDDPDVRALLDG